MTATQTLFGAWLLLLLQVASAARFCPSYADYSQQYHAPFSTGRYNLSSQRPIAPCRTYNSTDAEVLLRRYKSIIRDPDLYQLFYNAWPNTLDTTIAWRGYANNDTEAGEELSFIITGDINAMWLRDSANQLQSYVNILKPSNISYSIASVFRGAINLQARYLMLNPFCNSFQPPPESGIAPAVNGAASDDVVKPTYSNQSVFECKYELDSLAAFLQLSYDYYNGTGDAAFFSRHKWLPALTLALDTAESMMVGTYAANGSVNASPYTFVRTASSSTETLDNSGAGNPVLGGTGLIRSAFRPSDDATIYQLFIPANMMFAAKLEQASAIVRAIGGHGALYGRMCKLAAGLRAAIAAHGVVMNGSIYAYEVDGYGSANLMDDANIPSLLSAPLFGFVDLPGSTGPGSTGADTADNADTAAALYARTRARLLGPLNPYWQHGPVLSAVGGPHDGPGHAWPMASIVRAMTSDDDGEIAAELRQLVSSTAGLGLVHESVNTFNASDWTRQWFSWANGLFGQLIIGLEGRKPHVLRMSFQG